MVRAATYLTYCGPYLVWSIMKVDYINSRGNEQKHLEIDDFVSYVFNCFSPF